MNSLRAADVLSVDMIRRLVAFNTVSRNPNRANIDFIRDYCTGLASRAGSSRATTNSMPACL
ncbi:MAG: hypothetical protein IH626_01275 [Rhodospirillales bacterium]|nr:hypothetical protein [Rhodospirillales bacterium]